MFPQLNFSENKEIDFKNIPKLKTYFKVNNSDLSTPLIKNNAKFLDLIQLIEENNIEIENFNKTNKKKFNFHWKQSFISRLHNNLIEIKLTRNPELKLTFLERLHKFTLKQLETIQGLEKGKSEFTSLSFRNEEELTRREIKKRIKSANFPNNGKNINNQEIYQGKITGEDQNFSKEKNLLSPVKTENIERKKKKQPSDFLREIFRDYKNKHRTYIIGMPNSEKLKNYKRKQINISQEIKENSIFYEESPKTLKEKCVFLKPILQEEKKNDISSKEEINTTIDKNKKKIFLKNNNRNYVNNKNRKVGNKKKKLRAKSIDEKYLKPLIKVFSKDDLIPVNKFTNEEKLKAKFEIRSNFLNYVPENSEKEIKMHKLWLENRQKNLAFQRENQEIEFFMKKFNENKGIILSDIDRKISRNYEGNYFNKRNYSWKKFQEDEILIGENQSNEFDKIIGRRKTNNLNNCHRILIKKSQNEGKINKEKEFLSIEKLKSMQKLKELKETEGKIIKEHFSGSKIEDLENSLTKSLSIYQNSKRKYFKPFSLILNDAKNKNEKIEQIEEIEKIKVILARENIPFRLNSLKKALLIPDDQLDETKLNKLPKPGSLLIDNKFAAGDKKTITNKKKNRNFSK